MQKKYIRLIISLLILGTTGRLYAEFDLSGQILHDSRVLSSKGIYPEDSTGEFVKSISRLELKVERTDEEGFTLFGSIWATYDHLDSFNDQFDDETDNTDSTDLKRIDYDEFCLREAYATANYGPFEFKVGQMILNWGRTDELNPVDVVNPEDLSESYTVEKMERKIPVLLFNGLVYINDFTFQAVWIPFFEPARIPSKGPWSMLQELRAFLPDDQFSSLDFNAKEEEGKRDIDNSEVAARLTGLLGSLDFGFVFFYGNTDMPAYKVQLNNSFEPVLSKIIYRRYHGYGFDFAYPLAGYTLRGEALYRDKILYPMELSITGLDNHLSSDIQSIFAIEKIFGENLLILLQVVYNRVLNYRDELLAKRDEFTGWGTIEDKFFHEELKIGLAYYLGFNDMDWMLQPYIEYSLSEDLKANIGMIILDGPDDSQLGQYKNNDMVSLRITYNF